MKLKYWIIGAVALYGASKASQYSQLSLGSAPAPVYAEGTVLHVKLLSEKVIDENGIGDDWSFRSLTEDGQRITSSGISVDVSGRSGFMIESIATELDPSHDDVGRSRLNLSPLELNTAEYFTETVRVYERYGDGAGNTAICEFRYFIEIDTLDI